MTAEEFILDKWNSCTCFTHESLPGDIIMVYDPTYLRKKKLKSLFDSNEDITFYKTEETQIYFFHDYKSRFLEINYDEIWFVLENIYKLNLDDIQSIIKKVLLEGNKLSILTPIFCKDFSTEQLVQIKLNLYYENFRY